ncbi:MAG: hypothetical protein WDM89_11460 [Rhizomicrobium sp.]
MSVGALLGMEAAKGLFHKAIPQSGASHIGRRRESSTKIANLCSTNSARAIPPH